MGVASGVPKRSTSRVVSVRAAATVTCWPRTARTASSKPSSVPGTRRPASAGKSAPSTAWMAAGSASRSSQARTRAITRGSCGASESATRTCTRCCSGSKRQAIQPRVSSSSRSVRATVWVLWSICSTPAIPRCCKNCSISRTSYGGRKPKVTAMPSRGAGSLPSRRNAVGLMRYCAANAALKRRRLAKPAASATCATGRRVSASNCLAASRRRVCSQSMGDTPNSASNTRRRWRSLTPRRAASPATLGTSSPQASGESSRRAACWASRADASCADQASVCGASSGRQRRQGRKPAPSACEAWAKKRQFSRRGVFTRQTGRQ